jgi:hypothetical protein
MSESFVPMYDLESLSEKQRQDYLRSLCKHLGVPDDLNLVSLVYIDDGDGPAHLVAYVKRGAAESIRSNLGIEIRSLLNQMVGGSIVFTATGVDKNGRQEIAVGSKYIEGLSGSLLDDSIMTASTRALRRLAIQFTGTGILDESEVNQRKTVNVPVLKQSPLFAAPQPMVAPSSEPGKDITLTPLQEFQKQPDHDMQKCVESNVPCGNIVHDIGKWTEVDLSKPHVSQTQEEFEARQAKIRADAITQLNQNTEEKGALVQSIAEPVKKTRKPRGPNKKKTIDLGPSEPQVVEKRPLEVKPTISGTIVPVIEVTNVPALPAPPVVISAPVTAQPAPAKPLLTKEQTKPYRARHFKIMEQLEEGGFTNTEGMGRADKLRHLVMLMFPELTNMNDLSETQWEYYLSSLEKRLKESGAKATVAYIEESIAI